MNEKDISKTVESAHMSISVIMPVYNEVKRVLLAIEEVLSEVQNLDLELIIIESGSSDGTREIVESFLFHPNVIVIFQEFPLGKGNAVRQGLKIARKQAICIFDSDLEYRFSDVFNLLAPIAREEAEFVLGSRWAGHSIRVFETHNWKATLLNVAHLIGTLLINVSFGIKTQDPFTMWKVFTRDSIKGIDFKADRFDWDLEVVGELSLKGFKPIEIPATYNSRDYAQGKKIRFSKEVPILLKVVFRIFKKRVKQIVIS